ncbi:MAG TPA: prenyltransferase/squalene oxidase repeat-containing protein [Gemmataceae bacterium]|nr:prenyltransferase/squalene oxidase repeat-containing protein [Gemmataceae bacterium]
MFTRRDFLASSAALLGAAAVARADRDDQLPDGSASRGMITREAEAAIDKGLTYLANRRHRDGSFGTNQYTGNVAVTSLAALAFMAGGHQPGRGAYGRVVTEAIKFVLDQEDAGRPGYLNNARATPHGPMYGHGFGALLLGEAYGMVHDKDLRPRVRDVLRRAVNLIVRSQNIEGGWRYTPVSRDADISVTICQIMALRSAKNAGLAVPKATVDRCVKYVQRCQNGDGSFRYQAQVPFGGAQAFARTAAGVCALYAAGIYKGDSVDKGLKYLMNHKPNNQFRHDMHYFYGHYYAVQAMWTAGGDYWKEWFPAIRDELAARQQADGSWADPICRHYGTAMACIILQVPNNYLPILQK